MIRRLSVTLAPANEIESMEPRSLLSLTIPSGAYIFWDRLPDIEAGQRDAIVMEVKGPNFRRVTAANGPVQLEVVSGPGLQANTPFGTTTFKHGLAILQGLTFRTSGNYTIAATTDGVVSTESGFTVSPARPAAMQFNGYPNYLYGNMGVQFAIEVVDRFGNVVATDHSRMMIGPAKPKAAKVHLVAFDSQGNPFSNVLVRNGQQYGYAVQVQYGMAFFDLSASDVTGNVSVKIIDSNHHLRPITSPVVPVE